MIEQWIKRMTSITEENYQESLKTRGFGLAVVKFG